MQPADVASINPPFGSDVGRVEPPLKAELQVDSGPLDCSQRRVGVCQRQGDGLLRIDVFTGLGRFDDVPGVVPGGRDNGHSLHVVVSQQRLVININLGHAQSLGCRPADLKPAANDGDQPAARQRRQVLGVDQAQPAQADAPQVDRFWHSP
jgi:hypothetical protein